MNSQKRSSLIMMACKGFVISVGILNRNAARKRKHARDNQPPFIAEDISQAIMKTKRRHNNFHKNRTVENKTSYTKKITTVSHFCKKLKIIILQT